MIFGPELAPPGVTLRLLPMWASRQVIRPRLILVHTNGASREGSIDSAYNWALGDGNTKPHYQVDRDGSAAKFLPSDRRGTANYLADVFGLSIETGDLGWPSATNPTAPGGTIGFTSAQAETVARIIAYETEVWSIPIEPPAAWDGAGVGAHTDPFGYPYWTMHRGKPCPGAQKKLELRNHIYPRARVIAASWKTPTPTPGPYVEDEDMAATLWRHPAFWNVFLIGTGPAINVSPKVYSSLLARGVPSIVEDHDQMLKTCLVQAGLELSDLVPSS